jgi:hypothetical protein
MKWRSASEKRIQMWHFIYGFLFALISACVLTLPGRADVTASPQPSPSFLRHDLASPSSTEQYCAWFADRAGEVVYFGQAAFWWGFRSSQGADPARDYQLEGPRPIGRFDLRSERHLPPLEVGAAGARSGVWDVFRHSNGRVYFTTFFETAGYVDPDSGRVVHFEDAGTGLNELAPGPEGAILATRYASAKGGPGSVVLLEPEGAIRAEHVLVATAPGFQLAAKTAVLDPIHGDIWVNSDLLPTAGHDSEGPAHGPGGSRGAAGHPTLVLGAGGHERARIDDVEVQAMAFGADGSGYFAVVEGPRLSIAVLPPRLRKDDPRRGLEQAQRVLLDDNYPRTLDFAQALEVDETGRVILTRWSGHVHVLERADASPASLSVRSLRLPAYEPGGLYYAAFLSGDRICATYCGRVSVVCGPASALAAGRPDSHPRASKAAETSPGSDTAREQLR